MKKVCIVLFCFLASINAEPYRFMRLIKAHGDTIEKTVDLIFEVHHDIGSPATKGSRRSKKILSPQERSLYAPHTRALISTLRTMANKKQGEPIALLWELEEERIKTNGKNKIFLNTMGITFSKEFAPDQKKRIIFINADNYRYSSNKNGPISLYNWPKSHDTLSLHEILPSFERLLNSNNSLAEHDLAKAKEHIDLKTSKKLEAIYLKWKAELKKVYELLKDNKEKTVTQFMSTLTKEQYDHLYKTVIARMEDIELLLKTFASPQKHVIIYAGGIHCEYLDFILRHLGFKEAIDVGIDEFNKDLLIPLDPNAFTYLAINPQISWNIIKKETPKDLLPTERFETELSRKNIDMLLENPTKLKTAIKQYRKILVDLPKIYLLNNRQSLLSYAINTNQFPAARILIEHGAKPATIHLLIAMKKRKLNFVQFLLDHGVKSNEIIYQNARKIGGPIKKLFDEYKKQNLPSKQPLTPVDQNINNSNSPAKKLNAPLHRRHRSQ